MTLMRRERLYGKARMRTGDIVMLLYGVAVCWFVYGVYWGK